MKASECAFDRIKEAFEQVAQDEAAKVSVVQEIMRRSHNVLLVPALQQFPFGRLHVVGLWGENMQNGGAQFVERSSI